MPLHLRDLDVLSEVSGTSAVLIVPCNMCPAVTVALREEKPFIRLFRNFLKSAPYEQHIKELQSQLREEGIRTKVFKSNFPHQWFLCMWTSGRRQRLEKYAKGYDAVIVLGCDSATETVKESIKSANCKVVQGMEVVGFTNAKLKFNLPCNVSFEDGNVIPMTEPNEDKDAKH